METIIDKLYYKMWLIRLFEESVLKLFDKGLLSGTTHACIGQEHICVGLIERLNINDHIFSNHRCHGHYLAKTNDVNGLLNELLGNKNGICNGIGGSQHIGTKTFKSNGIQGGIVSPATGIALGFKLQKKNNISVVFLGDGTFGQGVVYESLNIASLWQLPILYIVENNQWAQSTPIQNHLAGSIKKRFDAFDINITEYAGIDVLEIYNMVEPIIQQVRYNIPQAIVFHTNRLCSHSKNDDCRPPKEIELIKLKDPLLLNKNTSIIDKAKKDINMVFNKIYDISPIN